MIPERMQQELNGAMADHNPEVRSGEIRREGTPFRHCRRATPGAHFIAPRASFYSDTNFTRAGSSS